MSRRRVRAKRARTQYRPQGRHGDTPHSPKLANPVYKVCIEEEREHGAGGGAAVHTPANQKNKAANRLVFIE